MAKINYRDPITKELVPIPAIKGDSAYEIAVKHGYNGTEEEWLESIQSAKIDIDDELSDTSENPIQNKIVTKALDDKVNKITGKSLSTNDLTDDLKSNYDSAYTHSESAHAPTDAEKNVVVGIQKNGADITPDTNRKVNITVPTQASDIGAATQDDIDAAITGKENSSNKKTTIVESDTDYPTSKAVIDYVAGEIQKQPNPMQYKGSLGVGGTITELPDASANNDGYVYKVITDATYKGQSAKVGDMFISNGTEWTYIPSGDDPSGTVISVGVSMPNEFTVSNSPITESGTIEISMSEGYSVPSIENQNTWNTAIQTIKIDGVEQTKSENTINLPAYPTLPSPVALTIPTTSWTAETSGEYEYYADITISGATANDSTNVYFDEDSLEVCAEAGVSSATNTTAGKCRLRSVDLPSGALTGVYVLTKGAPS